MDQTLFKWSKSRNTNVLFVRFWEFLLVCFYKYVDLSKGASISRPLLLDETNYPDWKTRMRAFIRALDVRAWRSILIGWTPLTVTGSEGTAVWGFSQSLGWFGVLVVCGWYSGFGSLHGLFGVFGYVWQFRCFRSFWRCLGFCSLWVV